MFSESSDFSNYKSPMQQMYKRLIAVAGAQSDIFQELIGELNIGIYCFNKEGKFVYANEKIQQISGYSEQDLLQRHFFDIIHPEDQQIVKERGMKRVNTGEGIISYTLRLIAKDGSVRYTRISADRIILDGETYVLGFSFDATKQALIEQELETSKKKLTQETTFLDELINASPEAIVITDAYHIIKRINPAFTELYGYSTQEAVGKNINTLIAKNEELTEAENISEQIVNGKRQSKDSIRYHKNGNKIHVSILGAPVYIKKELVAVYGIYRDISSRYKYQEDILKSQQEMAMLMKNMPGIIYKCSYDESWTMRYLSSGCEYLTGYKPEELIDNRVAAFVDLILEADREPLKNLIDNTINQNMPWEAIYRIHTRHRGIIWVREVGHSVKNDSGEIEYLEGFISDYTEQHKAYAYKNVLFEISDLTIQATSPAELYHGIHRRLDKVMDTRNFFIALYDGEKDSIRLVYLADEKDSFGEYPAGKTLTGYLIKQGKSLLTDEEQILKLQDIGEVDMVGSPCESWLGVPLQIDHEIIGAIVVQSYEKGFRFTLEDQQLLEFVSEHVAIAIQRINYEEDLKRAKEQAEESDTLKSSFLANMSHEIRSPMNAILGFAELLKESDLEPELAEEYLNIVIKRSKDLMVLIDEIIDLSKIDAGIFKLNNSDILVNDLLKELHAFYQLEKKKREREQLDIRLNLPQEYNNTVMHIDVPRLNQVFNNLVINAMKFTKEGYIEIGYTIKKNVISFYVHDTGIGIPKDKQSIIFERFRQADESHTREYQGTGLGLSITKAILEKMGGRIWVESMPQKGSTFHFSLPLEETLFFPNKPENNIQEQFTTKSEGIPHSDILILVAEDDITNYRFLETLLKIKKLRCLHATDGERVLEIIKNKPVTLILMDIRMPNMDGLEATRELRKQGYDIPIIAQTANAMSDDRQLALDAGCTDYLAKPIRKEQLFKLLEKYL
ncbi:MAG: hypothetical protein C0593_07685 [Marinilabiliales bacterium]|nr:MAG: hypothetical protein C0593_07685 [Marinilabiliales bacterium]